MIASARCLIQPSFKIQSILRAILRDEIITWNKKTSSSAAAANQGGPANPGGENQNQQPDGNSSQQQTDNKDREVIIEKVTNAVRAILSRLNR